MDFEWSSQKANSNYKKHGVSFDEASTVFFDALSVTYPDYDHSSEEERYLIVGVSKNGRMIIVSHVYHGETIRIISARPTTKPEQTFYERGKYR